MSSKNEGERKQKEADGKDIIFSDKNHCVALSAKKDFQFSWSRSFKDENIQGQTENFS